MSVSCQFSCHGEPLQAWKQPGIIWFPVLSLLALLLCFYQRLAFPKALCQDLPVNLSSFLLGHHSRTSFWICSFQSSWAWFSFTQFIFSLSGSFSWALSCSFTPSRFFPPASSSQTYRLAFNCSLVILLSLVLSFSKSDMNTLRAKN